VEGARAIGGSFTEGNPERLVGGRLDGDQLGREPAAIGPEATE
jgi:hypothetical protein